MARWTFRVGDRVELNVLGRQRHVLPKSREHTHGTVKKICSPDLSVRILWDHRRTTGEYCIDFLRPIAPRKAKPKQ